MRLKLLILSLTLGFSSFCQLPETLVTTRSIVVMELPLVEDGDYLIRGNWKEEAKTIQKSLAVMGVDAIAYLHAGDWNASASSKETFQSFFQERAVKHLITFFKTEMAYLKCQSKISVHWGNNGE